MKNESINILIAIILAGKSKGFSCIEIARVSCKPQTINVSNY